MKGRTLGVEENAVGQFEGEIRIKSRGTGFCHAKRLIQPIALFVCFWLILIVLYQAVGGSFFGSSVYNSYTLQALAWREGRVSLGRDYPHLELAVFNDDWYVSFPPVPSIPMYLLSFFFGVDTPDALMVKLYALTALVAVYVTLVRRKWNRWGAAFLALMMTLGGSMLPLVMEGAVWYQAQVMAFGLMCSSIALMMNGKMTLSLFLYALAVGCRPFDVCYGPLLILLWYLRRPTRSLRVVVRRLGPGIILGLTVASAYAAYNWIRFGNIFEFGHNYLPEFTRSANGQFSLSYLPGNIRRFIFGLPVYRTESGWEVEKFGASVFLCNPMLLLLMIWYVRDLICRRAALSNHLTIFLFLIQLFLLLLHRTGGGFQLGARYAVDLVPYSLIYLGLDQKRRRPSGWEALILLTGFILAFIGTTIVHI